MTETTLDQAERVLAATKDLSGTVNEARGLIAGAKKQAFRIVFITTAIAVPLSAFLAITLHDEHIYRCMTAQPHFKSSPWCDRTFPFHDHDEIQANLQRAIQEVLDGGR